MNNRLSTLAFLRWFLGTVLLILMAVALLSWLVNPWGLYAPNLLPPMLWNGPAKAVERWQQTEKNADILILGSSRVEALRCEYIVEATSKSCYNGAAHGSYFEEQSALLNYLLETHTSNPEVILLGIEVRTFPNNVAYGEQVVMTEHLLPYISSEKRLSAQIANSKKLIAVGQIKDSLRSLMTQLPKLLVVTEQPAIENNTTQPVQAQPGGGGDSAEKADHGAAFRANIDQSIAMFVEHYAPLNGLSAERLADLEQLIALADARDIELVLFVTPTHSSVLSAINANTPYSGLQSELNAFVAQQSEKYSFKLFDFTMVTEFDGSESDFISADHLHPMSETSRQMALALLQQ